MMTVEKETLRRVQDGLYNLRRGLAPFVEIRMKGKHGANWLHYASRAQGGSANTALDEYGLLKTMVDNWRDVFDKAFGRNDKHRVRNFTSTALEARNATSHLSIPLQDDEALRFLDAMHQLLKAVKGPIAEIAELKKLYDSQRHSGMPAAPAAPIAESATPARPTLSLGPREIAEEKPGKALRPWIEIALPHPDVLANRFKEAEFAANLAAVDAGIASEDYATPESFFRITFRFLSARPRGPTSRSRSQMARKYTWGYIAWQLAGDAGLNLVAEAEAARTNPGWKLLVDVMKLAGPCIILLDELVKFARQLPDERFEAFLSFVSR
jgi:hypothetical protein